MNIVYMGTPDFAVAPLQALIDAGHSIKAVYTQPDRPKGRGHKLVAPPVKELALQYDIPVYQPVSLKNPEEIERFQNIDADICVVAAYGKILPKSFLDTPKFGCINIHGSLLPLYRGAAPIQWSVINGDKATGITIMHMSVGLDEGDIILQESVDILENDTSEDMYGKLSTVGAGLILKVLELISRGDASRISQDQVGIEPTYAPMLSKDLSRMDFSKSAQILHNLVRGLYPWPVAKTIVNGKNLKVFKTSVLSEQYDDFVVGQIVSDDRFIVKCGDDTAIELLEVQVDGKKRTTGADFMRGYRLKSGDEIGE